MTDWSAGYLGDVDYTYGYYPELNPLRMSFALQLAAQRGPEPKFACELGFGQGISVNVHAAASDVIWYGTDFNPAMAGLAQELARASGAEAHLFDQSFAEFCTRTDLPDFDIISMHGIWSWIDDANRAVLIEFLRRKLKPGGLLYVSYNTEAGWAGMVPLRTLMHAHATRMSPPGLNAIARVDAAIGFLKTVVANSGVYGRLNPSIEQRVNHFQSESSAYLAHEFFNRNWRPQPFVEVADQLSAAKLEYACPGQPIDHVDGLHLSAEQQAFLAGIQDPVFRQTVRDVLTNATFRRDIWVKGRRPLSGAEQTEALTGLRLMLVNRPADVALKVVGSIGESQLNDAVYLPIIQTLSGYEPQTLGELTRAPGLRHLAPGQIMQAITVLVGKSDVAVLRSDAEMSAAKPATDRLNRHICNLARGRRDITTLASPILGGGIRVDRFQQLFLLANAEGATSPERMAQFATTTLRSPGETLVDEGKTIETEAETSAALLKGATEFAETSLTMLQRLRVA